MSRIRIYQSHFYVLPPFPIASFGVPVLRSVNTRSITPQLRGAMAATGCNGPELWNPPRAVQSVGVPIILRVDVKAVTPRLNGAMVATGCNQPELWNTIKVTTGWEFQQPALVLRRTSQDPDSSDGTPPIVAPILAPPQSGWSIVMPDLRRARPAAALAALDSLSLPLGQETPPFRWSVSLAELKQVKPRVGFADASIAPEAWAPLQSVAQQPWGWSLPPPSRQRVAIDTAVLSPVGAITARPQSGWTIEAQPLCRPQSRIGALRTSLSFSESVQPAAGWTVTLPDLPPFKRKIALPDQPSGLERAKVIPAAIGWTVEPPITLRRPTSGGALAGATLAPQTINPVAIGWSIVLPDLRQPPRSVAFQPDQAELYNPPVKTPPTGWTVEAPLLRYPRYQIGARPVHISVPPLTGTVFVEGWTVTPPFLRYPRSQIGSTRISIAVSTPTVAQPTLGWQVAAPDLVRATKPAISEYSSRLDQPQQPFVTGWTVVTNDLPAFKRVADLSQTLARSDQPQGQPYGWSITLPELLPKAHRDLSAYNFRFDPSLAIAVGWTVTLPELPQFKRKIALPDSAAGLDRPQTLPAAVNWTTEPAITRRRPTSIGSLAGADLPAEAVNNPTPYGWSVVLPDLPQFRRKQALPETTGRIDQPAAQPFGWDIVTPDLARVTRVALPEPACRIDQPTAAFPWGWSVVLPDLPAGRRFQALPEFTARIDFVTPTTTVVWGWQAEPPTILAQKRLPFAAPDLPFTSTAVAVGWSVVLPDLPVFRGHSFATADLEPEVITQPAVTGWSIVVPDLPQFIRRQALPEGQGRLDQPLSTTGIVFVEGWSVVLPLTRVQSRSAGVLAGADLPPTAPQQQPYGWNISVPDLPLAVRRQVAAGPDLPPQAISTPAVGWDIALPDLPQFKRVQALPETTGRIDQPPGLLSATSLEWVVELPVPRAASLRLDGVLVGPVLAPQAVTTSAVGWDIVIPDLRAARRFQALPEATGRIDQAIPTLTWGWQTDAFTPPPRRRAAQQEGVSTLLGGETYPWGWSVVTPDLRRPHPPSFAGGDLAAQTIVAAAQTGWSIETGALRYSRYQIGAKPVHISIPPLTIPNPTGWSIVLPDLRAARRFQALPEGQGRLDQPASVTGAVFVEGWTVTPPFLRYPRYQIGSSRLSIVGNPVSAVTPSWGWQSELPSLRHPPANPAGLAGKSAFVATAAPPIEGWRPVLPVTRARPRTAGVLAGADLPPTPQPQPQPSGWQSELPPTRRVHANPGGLAGKSAFVSTAAPPIEGWQPVLPVTRARPSTAGVLAGADLPPTAQRQTQLSGWETTLPVVRPLPRRDPAQFAWRADFSPTVAVGWNIVLPDLPQFRREQAVPDQPSGLDHRSPIAASIGWTVEPSITKSRPTGLGALAGPTLAPQSVTTVAVGWSIVTPDLPQFRRKPALSESIGRIDQAAGLQSATSLGWIAELPIVRRLPPRDGILAGADLAPQTITQPAITGWNIITPDLPQFMRHQAFPETTGRIDQEPQEGDTLRWQIDQPPIRNRRGPVTPVTPLTLALGEETFPWGWSIVTPDLRRRQSATFAGADLAAQTIVTAAQTGWSIVLPELPAGRRFQALPEGQGRLDQPSSITGTIFVEGWSVVLPITLARPTTGGALAGADLPSTAPQQQPFGETVITPDLPQFRRNFAVPETASGRLDKPRELSVGWDVVLPDLPAFRRKFATPDAASGLDRQQAISADIRSTVELPLVRSRPTRSFAGADLAPQAIGTAAVGWSVILPDLRAARRYQALPEAAGRIDQATPSVTWGWQPEPTQIVRQPSRLSDIPQPELGGIFSPSGWSIVLPDLRRPARPDQTWFAARLDFTTPSVTAVSWWVVEQPDPAAPHRNIGALASADLTQAGQQQPSGWTVTLPDLPRRTRPDTSWFSSRIAFVPTVTTVLWWVDEQPDLVAPHRNIGALAGPDLPQAGQPQPSGWTVTLPDLSVTHRPAQPAFTSRIDQPAEVVAVTPLWWEVTLPDIIRAAYRDVGQALGRLDLPQAQPQAQPFGWSVVLPDLPRFRRISDVGAPVSAAGGIGVLVIQGVTPRYVLLAPATSYVTRAMTGTYAALAPAVFYTIKARRGPGDARMPQVLDLPAVAPSQVQTCAIDFGNFLPAGVTLIGTPTLSISLHRGTADLSPSSRITGPTIGTVATSLGGTGIANVAILFQVHNCVGGVTYLIEVVCARSDSDVAEGSTHLSCIAPS